MKKISSNLLNEKELERDRREKEGGERKHLSWALPEVTYGYWESTHWYWEARKGQEGPMDGALMSR